jgi:hypothetical protein
MTDFAVFLREKVERYIELRRALGCAFDKQAGTLRAFVRHIERLAAIAGTSGIPERPFILLWSPSPVSKRRIWTAEESARKIDEVSKSNR